MSSGSERKTDRRVLVLAGLLLIALNLRPAIASISPVLEQIRVELGLSYAAVSLLTTLPTICMGVFALIAAPVAERLGRERTVYWAVVLIGLATVTRFAGGSIAVLFVTAILVGAGIALVQALLPALVERYFPNRVALVTGLYTAGLIGGAAIAAGATAPLARLFESWQSALALWAVLAFVAAVVWRPVVCGERSVTAGGSDRTSQEYDMGGPSTLPWRSQWAWILALFYSGTAFLYFATLTWLAPFYQSLGWSKELSGFLLTVFTVAEIGGVLIAAVLIDRFNDRRPAIVVTLLVSGLGFGAIALVPLSHPLLWAAATGIGMGSLFDLSLVLPVDYAPTPSATARVSSMVIGVGYLLSALGLFVIGKIRDFTGGFEAPFFMLVGINVVMLMVSVRFRSGDVIKMKD